uniref:Malonyl CoA-acyl carrier protein transacylase n=1 Tax=uncultured bacterium contig00031 TaxID=1181520 RepID=A0A806KEG2_9BACT|nr:malonyl CoA-acyl carrier protein transacylase [uncultured bacterium contig00031]
MIVNKAAGLKSAFYLFPGQGAQYSGMALDLLEKSERVKCLFSTASEINGKDMTDLLGNSNPETLKKADVAQPTITLANLAAAAYLAEKGVKPVGCAGFSLGEYAALAVSGVITIEECFSLVKERGKAMQAAIDSMKDEGSGMAAVIGLAYAQVEALLAELERDGLSYLYAANINSPKQIVVSGSAGALEEAEKHFKAAGARHFIRLDVAGPFHSPFMKEAADAFVPALEKVKFKDPFIPVYSNVTGKQIRSGTEAKTLAIQHITEAVRWTDEEAAIEAAGGMECLLETGPGKVLQGLWKHTGSTLPCYAAGTAAEINGLVNNGNGK